MKRFFSQPHTLFVFFALLFGVVLVFLQPTGAGYDEETHIARIYEMSSGHIIPNSYLSTNGVPESFSRVSYRQQKFLTPIDWNKFKELFQVRFDGEYNIGHLTRATYSPVVYFPQAVIMFLLGRGLNLSLPLIYYIIRLSYLLSFTLMGFFAIRTIPIGKWVLFVLMLAPTTLLQFSSVNADAITFGVSFLFIAWSLHLVVDKVVMNRKNIFITLILVFLLASVKINSLPLVLLLVFLKSNQFVSRKMQSIFWVTLVLLVFVVAGGWNFIAWNSDSVRRGLVGTSPLDVVISSLKEPFAFIGNLFSYIAINIKSVISTWIATYGYGYWSVPAIVIGLTLLALLLALTHDLGDNKIPFPLRLGLYGLFLVLFIGTFALRLILKQNMESLVSTQGRYFVVVMPLLFLGLTAWQRPLRFPKFLITFSTSFSVLAILIYFGGMGLSYYRLCGSNTYTGNDCMLPVYKNWGPSIDNMVVLPPKGLIQQSIVPDCDKIDRIRVETLILTPDNLDETFRVSLVDLEKDHVVSEQVFTMNQIQANGFIQMDFPPYEHIVNRELFIQLQGQTNDGQGLGIPVSDPGEYRGSFSVNGEEVEKDLLFHYRCVK